MTWFDVHNWFTQLIILVELSISVYAADENMPCKAIMKLHLSLMKRKSYWSYLKNTAI